MSSLRGMAALMIEELGELDGDARVEYAHRFGNPDIYEKMLLDGRDDPEDVARLMPLVRSLQIRVSWINAFETKTSGIQVHALKPDLTAIPPRWSSSIPEIDILTEGGFYGLTLITGRPKQGKSMLAQASAVEACLDGYKVIYLNAELTKVELANRVMRYLGRSCAELEGRFIPFLLSPNVTLERIVWKVHDSIEPGDQKVLVVFDSVNSIAEFAMSGHGVNEYFRLIKEIGQTLMIARRNTNALISGILVSEMNTTGGTKGGKLDYAADLMITMEPSKSDRDSVEIDVSLARSSRGGKVGTFRRAWARGRFESINQPAPDWRDEM